MVAFEKQMLEACDRMRQDNRERDAWREQLQERYKRIPGFKLSDSSAHERGR